MDPLFPVNTSPTPIGANAFVIDKAGGVAKAVFLNVYNEQGLPLFNVIVNHRRLIYPTHPHPVYSSLIQWFGSVLFTFERVQQTFLKIEEKDVTGALSTCYVDLNRNEIYHIVYRELPGEITKEGALKKIEGITHQKVSLLFNRHGTALITHEQEELFVYFAYPMEDRVKKIDCSHKLWMVKRGEIDFKSKDRFISLTKNSNVSVINHETACYVNFNE